MAVVEGEKDANSVRALGIIATCNAHGASELGKRPKWTRAHSEQLRGADIVVFNDNDGAGYAHADATCNLSLGVAKRVRRLDLAKHWPEIAKGGDVSDWLVAGHTGEELAALIEQAPDYVPPESAKKETSPPSGGNTYDTDAELERLAKLLVVQYEHERKQAAERLNVRASILDKLVAAERERLGLCEDDAKHGRAISFPELEPWPEPVDGAVLLDGLASAISAHVVMLEHFSHSGALWSLHTHFGNELSIAPRLAICSPTKRCGKTTLLDVLSHLVRRPKMAADISPSAIFRVVEAYRPTLLIDEADTFLPGNDDMRRLLNAGYRRGGTVIRSVESNGDFEPREFSVYAPCAIASIGWLHPTVQDRSVGIDLKPRKASEKITPFRFDQTEHLDVLARKAARWAADNGEAIRGAEPQMPQGVYNREADNWRPLLAIAEAAGGEWPARARAALMTNRAAEGEEGSRLELLIGDVRDIFNKRKLERISSAQLIEALVEIVPRPWAEYGKGGKPITQNKLARLLKPLAIKPQVLRIGEGTPNGYQRHQFEEAWEHFLPMEGAANHNTTTNADSMGTSEQFQTTTSESNVVDGKSQKSNNDGLCCGVAVEKGDLGQRARASDGNGRAAGLSQRTITELAEDYTEAAYRQNNEGADIDSRALDADLRRRLAGMVLPEFVEIEFERVMQVVFQV